MNVKGCEEMTIKVFEAFSGVGSQRMALRNIGLRHKVVAVSENDKYALKSYESIHGDCPNLGDIRKLNVEDIPDHDLFTYSFPCQDVSVAGNQKGLDEGTGTRSSLLWECRRVIEGKRPKYLLMENVKNLVGKKHKHNFDKWLEYLQSLGYTNYWEVLNAKDYGIPQNRERVFVVSILGEHDEYTFPPKLILDKRVKDILEVAVEDKYYMNKPFKLVDKGHVAEFTTSVFEQNNRIYGIDGIFRTLGAGERGQNNILVAARVEGLNDQNSRVFDIDGIAGTLDTMQGGHREPKILVVGDTNPSGEGMNGNIFSEENEILNNYKVRKLTPKECWRLMGFADEDFEKAKNAGLSNTQLYKQAGNSIVVPVLEGIFRQMFMDSISHE